MSWPQWRRALLSTYAEINDDRLLAVAAGVVFYGLLAIFPSIAAFVSLYGLFADSTTISNHLSLLSGILPGGALDILQEQIARIVGNTGGSLSLAFASSVGIALWSANAGMKAMIDALNVIEGVSERRGLLRLNALSLTLTLGAIVFLMLAVGVVVALPLVLSTFGLQHLVSTVMWFGRWPALLAIVLLAFMVLYRFGPNRDDARWRLLSPGILFAAFAWLAGSAALSLYLSKFADYNATYGSLGAAIGLMMWMWLTTIVVLLGAELDMEIDKVRHGAAAAAPASR
jgi:membrane protein